MEVIFPTKIFSWQRWMSAVCDFRKLCYALPWFVLLLFVITASLYPPLLNFLKDIDKKSMLLLNFDGPQWMDTFFYTISQTATSLPLIVGLVFMVLLSKGTWMQKIAFLVGALIILTLADQTASKFMKPFFGRLRPSHDPTINYMLYYVNGYHGGLHGFVSSHAAIWSGITAWIWLVSRNVKISRCVAVYAAIVSYSRIYLGVHYPGDILGGALVGIFWAWVVYRLSRRLMLAPHSVETWPVFVSVRIVVIVLAVQVFWNATYNIYSLLALS